MSSSLGSSLLCAYTFCVRQHGADDCDNKGLPLTANSINILGRFQTLTALSHPTLCAYLNLIKSRNERLIVVSEYHDDCLNNHIKSGKFSSPQALARLASQLLQALAYLNTRGITHRGLASENVLVTHQGTVKLHNYGLYYMTDHGREVNFPIGSPRYMAPEIIVAGPGSMSPNSPKVDVWSLGMILLELFMGSPVYPDLFVRNAVSTLFKRIILLMENYQRKLVHPLTALLEAHNLADKPMDPHLRSFLEACLSPLPSKRPSVDTLLGHPLVMKLTSRQATNGYQFLPSPFLSVLRCSLLAPPSPQQQLGGTSSLLPEDHLMERPLHEVYYLWSLAGGDPEVEMKRNGVIHSRPPICNLPCLMIHEGETYSLSRDRVTLYDTTVLTLSLDQLRKRLEGMSTQEYYPLMESMEDGSTPSSTWPHESAKLPLAIKEKDVEYQFHRVVIFSRLLESYPYSRDRIISEALTDICPLMRGEVWAALLGVKGDIHAQYTAIDKESDHPTDRQIAVDIPRCHQYAHLLASSEGHRKFKRVLKSWVISHHHLVYWQGLDSLCAPFLALNFSNEALVFSCLSSFISKYLHNFFLRDNSPIMQEYLAIFNQMIAFHEPELYNHLDSIAFAPELYAIPWFLTMFTHILPLNKIYHLWDTLLLADASFPLCVGVAILQQLRQDLLTFGFNECILTFSDMPDIDIQMCTQEAVLVWQSTPSSACVRLHEPTSSQPPSIPPEARRGSLQLATLKSESSLQISAHDLIILCHLESHAIGYSGSRHPVSPFSAPLHSAPLLMKGRARGGGRARQKAVMVDIRPQDEFRLGHVPHSISLPYMHAFQPDGSFVPSSSSSSLTSLRGRVIVVIANKGESGPVFARQLVRLNFPKVCVLYGGAGVLRSLGLFSSIQDDP